VLVPWVGGPTREEATRGRTKLHDEEVNNFYPSPNIVKIIKLTDMIHFA
jgi:hypothetical protein